jgi:hypothetical protein
VTGVTGAARAGRYLLSQAIGAPDQTAEIRAMRNSPMLRWIEEAEASAVLAAARFEQAPRRSRRVRIGRVVADRLDRMRGWLTPPDFVVGPLQARPVPVRRASYPPVRRSALDDEFCRRW